MSKKNREIVKSNLKKIIDELNSIMSGKKIDGDFKNCLIRINNNKSPHWINNSQVIVPNKDGKTIGGIIEIIFLTIVQTKYVTDLNLNLNSSRGIDFPELTLGLKSPSENYNTSEPFYSPYDRLIGSDYDSIVLITDYQTSKKSSGNFKVKVIKYCYLNGSEIADKNLCIIAKNNLNKLIKKDEILAQKLIKFLSYVNQSDWYAKQLLKIANNLEDEDSIKKNLENSMKAYNKDKDKYQAYSSEVKYLSQIKNSNEMTEMIISKMDDWVSKVHGHFGRLPNSNEWKRIKNSKFDGKIGMSYALQWRYNFKPIFK